MKSDFFQVCLGHCSWAGKFFKQFEPHYSFKNSFNTKY